MSIWSKKAFYAGLGAAVGAGVAYYLTQKYSEKFQERLDALNEKTEECCHAVHDWFAANTQGVISENAQPDA